MIAGVKTGVKAGVKAGVSRRLFALLLIHFPLFYHQRLLGGKRESTFFLRELSMEAPRGTTCLEYRLC